jgi:CheY-like chemotaxis protein
LNAPTSDYVLVVDDDEAICELIALTLGDEGYDVACCNDPGDALRLLAHRPSGLILLDLRMPAMDGETFLQAYRAMPNATAPIVIFSAMPNIEDQAACLGAIGSITKPFDLDDLISTVSQALPLPATAVCLTVGSPSPTPPM